MSLPSSAPTVPRWINRLVIWLLRSPFHPLMSRTTMLLTFTGRKSGRRYTIPVRYLRKGDKLFTTTDSRWWRNLQGRACVDLYLAGRKVAGNVEVSTNPADVEQALLAILHRMPRDARFYQIHLDQHNQPDTTSLKQAAQVNVLITITIGSYTEQQEADIMSERA